MMQQSMMRPQKRKQISLSQIFLVPVSYTHLKLVVMCACSNKEMYNVQKAVKDEDEKAFLIMMESNEVRGEGFKPHGA